MFCSSKRQGEILFLEEVFACIAEWLEHKQVAQEEFFPHDLA